MSIRSAEADVIWLLQDADTDACGLRASAANLLQDTDEKGGGGGGGGGRSKGFRPADYMPEVREVSRRRMRRISVALSSLPPESQAVLYARYLPRGPQEPIVMGLGVWTKVGELLASVRRRGEKKRVTPQVALREMVERATDAGILEDCKQLVQDALQLLDQTLEANRTEAEADRLRRIEQACEGTHEPALAIRARQDTADVGRVGPDGMRYELLASGGRWV